jgi:hypothetical protein
MMIIITGVAFVISVRKGENRKQLKIIGLYILCSLIFDIISLFQELFVAPRQLGEEIESVALNIFLLAEFTLLNYFFLVNISTRSRRIIVRLFFFAFFLWIGILWFGKKAAFYHFLPQFVVIESLCIIIPSLLFLFDLFDTSKILILKHHPPFWVAAGVLFYNSCSIPLFLLFPYFETKMPMYFNAAMALNYILYSFLFLLFIRAYLCKTS